MGFLFSRPAAEDHLRWIERLSGATSKVLSPEDAEDTGRLRELEVACWHAKLTRPKRDPHRAQADPLDDKERGELRDLIFGGALSMLTEDEPLDVLILLRIEELLSGKLALQFEDVAHRCPVGTVSLNGSDTSPTTFGHPWPKKDVMIGSGMPGCLGNSVLSKGRPLPCGDHSFTSIRDDLLHPDQGGDFTLTQQLNQHDDWTPGIVLKRQRQLAGVFLSALNL